MQLTAAFITVLGLAAALPHKDEYKPTYPAPSKDCHETKTCKAVYETKYKDVPVKTYKTVTTTEYKRE